MLSFGHSRVLENCVDYYQIYNLKRNSLGMCWLGTVTTQTEVDKKCTVPMCTYRLRIGFCDWLTKAIMDSNC